MKIKDLFRQGNPVFSFEFFPPKDDRGVASLFATIKNLRELNPSFVSVTYGAGGSTRRKTVEITKRVKQETAIEAISRTNSPSQRVFLTRRWLPVLPGLAERLDQGIRIGDVGCGSGTVAAQMAQAYPRSHVAGYDLSPESIAIARSRWESLDNLEFHVHPAEAIPTDPGFDLITAFDVIHDLADPLAAMRRIREALRTDGVFLMMEPNLSSDLAENLHPIGAMMYGVSTLHCLTQSLAADGAGLGAAWGSRRAEELAREAGFGSFERLEDISNRFSAFYLLRR